MPISALPTPPSRSDAPQDFSDRADALLGALPGFVTEANALQSDVNAKEASASSYATIATDKAAEAQGHATTASTKASEAAASAVAAAAAASNAEIAFDSFDDKYLGSKAGDPATDNDGNPLLTGALYWNTTVGAVRVWSGSAWLSMAADASIVDFQQAGAGAVVRTAQDKMRECVSVKDFGAVGDGVADDTAAIQAALNSANLLPYQVLEVVIPRGIYKITSTITQQANVVITGPGTVQPTAPFSGAVVWDYNNTAGYQDTAADSRGGIDRLRIKASGTIAATALRLTMGWSNVIRNVLVTGITGNGVHIVSGLWNLENVKVQHAFNYGVNIAIGFYLDGCADTSLTNVEAVGYNVGVYASPNAGNNHIIRAHCWGYWYDNTSLQPTGPLCRFPFVVEGDNNVFIRCVSDTPETSGASVPWSQAVGGIGYSLLGNSSTLIGCIVASSPVYLATPKLCGIYVNGEQNNIVACNAFYGMNNGTDGLVFSGEGKKITNYVSGGNINLHNTSAVANVPFAYNNGVEITTAQTAQVTAQKLSSNAMLLQISMTLASDPEGLPNFQAYLTGQYIPYSTTKVKFAVPEWSAFAKNAASKSAASVVGEIHLGTCRFYTVSNLGVVTDVVTLADFKNGTFSANVFIPITY